METKQAEQDYPEDFTGENGNYHHVCPSCEKPFTGHKRRVLCRVCAKMKESGGPPERMLKWFEYRHLPDKLQAVSQPFGDLAVSVVDTILPGPERTAGLRKLLEAKDCLVRAKLHPGG